MTRINRSASNKHQADVRPEYTLLGFLSIRDMHGYELHQQFQRKLGRVWHLSQSQLYATVKRLEAQGLVSATAENRTSGAEASLEGTAPSRRRLSITPEGSEKFESWLAEPSDCSSRIMRLEFISRLFFASSRDPLAAEDILLNQKAKVERELDNHRRLLEALAPDDGFNRLSVEFRIGQLEAQSTWLATKVEPFLRERGL